MITIEFVNKSLVSITNVAKGEKRFSKEKIEAFGGGPVAALDNFRPMEPIKGGYRSVFGFCLGLDKGHLREMEVFRQEIEPGAVTPIPFEEAM